MAGDQTSLGKLVVDLLLQDDQFQGAMKNAQSSMASGGAKLQQTARRAGQAITGAFAAAAAAITAFGATSAVVGANFEEQMAMVGALQGLQQTDKAFQDLQGQARLLGSTTEFSATQAAGALQDLARAGQSVSESILSSNSALVLAGTSASTLSESTQLLVSTQRQFGLSASESERITNVFSLAMRKSLLDFSSLTEAMKFAGITGKGFGMSLEETTASIAAFRDLGLQGSMAGTAFRMAMVQASRATDQQDAVLRKYGLTVKDINPEQNTFIDIVEKMGEVGLTATDAMVVFGSRAGASVAQLAAETAKGNVNMRAFTATMMTASDEGNTAADMYRSISQTIAFASKIAASAMQDLMIEVFDTFAGPMRSLIETLPTVLTTVTAAVKQQAPALKAGFASALEGIAKFLKDNAQGLADAFVNTMKAVVSLGPALQAIAQLLIVVARNADIVMGALAFGVAAVAAAKLVWVIGSLSLALGGTTTAVTVLGTALTVSTGGLFAAALAVGALVAGLVVLISNLARARNETQRLNDAQKALTAEQESSLAALEAELTPVLEKQKALAEQRLLTEDLTVAETQRLKRVMALTVAEAAQLEMEGKLVRRKGELREVADLVATGGEQEINALINEAALLERTVEAADRKIATLTHLHKTAVAAVSVQRISNVQLEAAAALLDREIGSIEELQVRLRAETEARETNASRASALRQQVASAAQDAIQTEIADEFDALREINAAKEAAGDNALSKQAQAHEQIMALHRKLQADLAKMRGDEEGQIRASLDRRLTEITRAFDEAVAAADNNASVIAMINAKRDKEIKLAREIARQEQANADAAAADERAQLEARLADRVRQITLQNMGTVTRLEAEKQAILLRLVEDGATARQIAEAKAGLDKGIGEAKLREERRVQDILLGLTGKSLSRREQMQREKEEVLVSLAGASAEDQAEALELIEKKYRFKLVPAIGDAAKAIGAFGSATVAAAKAGFGAMSNLVEQVSGFSFSLQGAVTDLYDVQGEVMSSAAQNVLDAARAEAEAAAEAAGMTREEITAAGEAAAEAAAGAASAASEAAGGGFSFADQAIEFIDGLVEDASRFMVAMAESIGPLLGALAEALPGMLQHVIDTIPVIIEALVEQIPIIVQSLVDALPDLISVLIEGIVDLVMMVLDMLPGLISDLLSVVLPSLIQDLAKAIPKIIKGIVKAIPLILDAIVGAIPIIFAALIDAIPKIVMAIVDAIPKIITSVLLAIPELVKAVMAQIGPLISMIIGMIPDIIISLSRALPELLPALFALIPMVYVEIIKAVPGIVFAVIDSLWTEIILRLPEMVSELWKGVTKGMGKAVKAVGKALWQAITAFIPKKKGKDGQEYKGFREGFGFSGINYVPATMRMTVHQGEAVVDAARNAERLSGQPAPAPAGAAQNGQGGGGDGGGGGQSIDVAFMVDGRMLDAVQVRSMQRGGAVGVQREIRRASGVRIGLDNGRFNPWSR